MDGKPVIDIRVLGPLEVTVDGVRIDPGGPRQRCVLARLVAARGKVVSADRLIEDLYADEVPPRALASIQAYVFHLRRALEPGRAARARAEVLITSPPGYALRLSAAAVDAWSFEEEARQPAGLEDPAATHARLTAALASWRGAAFEEFGGMPWADLEASRLEELRLMACERLAATALQLGSPAQVIADLSRLTAEHPLREEAWRLLALALYQSGRQGDALAALRRARTQLAEELGVDPGPALRQLEDDILAQAPALSAPHLVRSQAHLPAAAAPAPRPDDTRQAMADDLGIQPGERPRQLERPILTGDPAVGPPAGPVSLQPAGPRAPSLLPADIADFTGRAGLAEQVGRHLTEWEAGRLAAPVMVLTGPGGVGKTSLAVRVAHGVAGHFADGQLFADLHAGAGSPVGPGRMLERFLRALGVPGPQVPEDLDERAEVYRDLVANRKLLVVLDDAAGENQVLPLLPGTAPAAVLITSRRRLSGLAGAAHVEVSVLEADTSLALLGRIAGTSRVQAEPSAAAAVAGHCGHLPLALRVAGARLAERPHWDIQQLADRLADETRRLDELRHGDLAVRASISLTYEGASEQARRLLRRLAMLDAPTFSGWVAAALLGQPSADAEDALDQLVSARLVETTGTGTGVHSYYRLHDLIRVYGRERLLSDDPPAEQDAALERALGAMLYLAAEANRLCTFGDQLQINRDAAWWPLAGELTARLLTDPLGWFERERVALVAGVRQAARAGLTDLCWSLASATAVLFKHRAYFDDSRETHEIALQAARRAGHLRGQAEILSSRGSLLTAQQEYALARADLAAAAQLFHDCDDAHGLARVDADIAFLDRLTGRLEEAAQRGERALVVLRRTGDTKHAAFVLQTLAAVRLQRGELGPATDYLSEALQLVQAAGDSRTEALVLRRVGEAYLQARQPDRALETFERALTKVRDVKDAIGEAHLLLGVGVAKTRLGEFGDANATLQRALELATALGERVAAARALLGLGELALTRGDHGQAVVLAGQAADAFGKLGARPDELAALTLRSDASAAAGCLRSAPQ